MTTQYPNTGGPDFTKPPHYHEPQPYTQPPGYAAPLAGPRDPDGMPFLLRIGDIFVSEKWIVTPRGNAPVAGSVWEINNRTVRASHTPTWAIVLAIVLAFFFLISLLLLLVKETTIEGHFEVTVRSGPLGHATYLPAKSAEGDAAFAEVQYARYLAQRAAGHPA